MDYEGQAMHIIGVDKNNIRESTDSKGLWIIPFKLSLKPYDTWSKNFYNISKKTEQSLKRKIQIAEDCIEVHMTDTDDQQKVLDIIKKDVISTNALCAEDHQARLRMRQDLENLKKKQAETLTKFKENADKLQF